MKALNDTLPKLINSGVSEIKYDKDSLLKTLTNKVREPKKKWKKLFLFPYVNLSHFILFVSTAIVVVTLVLTFTFIFVKDILLFKSNLSINRQGVFMPSKSCGREYCLFLFNTSDLWANTGIYLNEGDKYKMSVSGAFHSSVEDMRGDAEENNPFLEKYWIGGEQREKLASYIKSGTLDSLPQYKKTRFCVDKESYIGAILYRIAPEYQLWDPHEKKDIHIWDPSISEDFTKVTTSGVLSLATNDIYFENENALASYIRFDPIRFEKNLNLDSIKEHDKNKEYKRMFYNDNLGQILVCLEIQHPLPLGFFNPLTAFRRLDTKVEHISEKTYRTFPLIIYSVPYFFVFLLHICAIFIIITLSTTFSVYVFLMLGYWLYLLVDKIKAFCEKNKKKRKAKKQHNTQNSNPVMQ
jgi:hypothetical protein